MLSLGSSFPESREDKMHPPSHICREIAKKHPWLRVAWRGREKTTEGEDNPGNFAIVQLYHITNSGTVEDPRTFMQSWEPEFGPIFNRDGGTVPDWDPLFRKPIYALDFANMGMKPEVLFSGQIVYLLDKMLHTERKSIYDEHVKKAADVEKKAKDIAEAAADRLWHEALKADSTGIDVPWEFARDDVAKMYRQSEQRSEQLKKIGLPYVKPA